MPQHLANQGLDVLFGVLYADHRPAANTTERLAHIYACPSLNFLPVCVAIISVPLFIILFACRHA